MAGVYAPVSLISVPDGLVSPFRLIVIPVGLVIEKHLKFEADGGGRLDAQTTASERKMDNGPIAARRLATSLFSISFIFFIFFFFPGVPQWPFPSGVATRPTPGRILGKVHMQAPRIGTKHKGMVPFLPEMANSRRSSI